MVYAICVNSTAFRQEILVFSAVPLSRFSVKMSGMVKNLLVVYGRHSVAARMPPVWIRQ